jgi:alpha-beta hydrolase superfamily lysophospholipase
MAAISKTADERKLTFTSDGFRLSGTLHLPETRRPALIIGSHGLLSTGNSPKQISLAGRCAAAGMAYFRFDHRGCGESEGNRADAADFDARCRDLRNAMAFLRKHVDFGSKTGLFGSSLGGAVCLSVAAEMPVHALVTVAAPLNSRSLIAAAGGVLPDGLSPEAVFSPRFRFDLCDRLSTINHLLIFHGENDSVVPVSHARQLFENAGDPKKLVIQESGDHVMSNPLHQDDFISETLSWFSACLQTD